MSKEEKLVSEAELAMGVPASVPSMVEIKRELPAHCLKSNAMHSLYYVFKDFFISACLYYALRLVESQPYYLPYLMFVPVYWFLQGTMFAAIFLIGHDCAHDSFSTNYFLNDLVGNLVHSFTLVPYYPWRVFHKLHHKNTNNIDRDENFFPVREKFVRDGTATSLEGYPPFFAFGLGWFYYMFLGYSPRRVYHYNPWDPSLLPYTMKCIVSLVSLATWVIFGVLPYYNSFGMAKLMVHYLVPIAGYGFWLTLITFLHHVDENVPWYGAQKWDHVRGMVSSVDRYYGSPWHHLLHNIGTHQIHHLFPKIPHYHLIEATQKFRKKFPQLVRFSNERLLPAFFRLYWLFEEQIVISDDTQIHAYRSKKK